jgi:hypothetical protein
VNQVLRVLGLAGLAVLLSVSASQAIIVEAESYVASFNAGGEPIGWVYCSAASGGRAVEGFDTTGDWIEVVVTIPEIYGYADSIRSAGYVEYESDIQSAVFGADPAGGDVPSHYHTVGAGIG